MKLSISNIGWNALDDGVVYDFMTKYGFSGLEIAPTRIFSKEPYDHISDAKIWSEDLKIRYGFEISSMQSIWFGRRENLFASRKERNNLKNYTKEAIDFASAIGCKNLVFGCPRNRNIPDGMDSEIAIDFFKELGEYAFEHNTVIALEANPPLYHTNYINDTKSAIDLIKKVGSKGFLLNLDLGTILQNKENISELIGNVSHMHHVHISEPGLRPLKKRRIHIELKKILINEGYDGYISIEIGKVEDVSVIEENLQYVRSVFAQDSRTD